MLERLKESSNYLDQLMSKYKKIYEDSTKSNEYTIVIKCNSAGKNDLLPLLEEIKHLGSVGSSRTIKIVDEEGVYGFDGDGPSRITSIDVIEGNKNINEDTSSDERNIRELLASEYIAVKTYEEFATNATSKKVNKVLSDIAKEELVHIGELEQLLKELGMSTDDYYKQGADEVKKTLSEDLINDEGDCLSSPKVIINKKLLKFIKENPYVESILQNYLTKFYPDEKLSKIEIQNGNVRIGKEYSDVAQIVMNELKFDISTDSIIAQLYTLASNGLYNKEKLDKDLEAAYSERAALVSFVSKLYDSYLSVDKENIGTEFSNVVYINSPKGQLSWHIKDSDLHLFSHLNVREENNWDGHSTEEKYKRLDEIEFGINRYLDE